MSAAIKRREFIMLLGGEAATWPLAARAQQQAMPVIGLLSSRSPHEAAYVVAAFHRGLREGGYSEGQNVGIEYRWAEGQYDRLPELAVDLVRRRVALIASTGGIGAAVAAKQATSTIPIVFTAGDDPIKHGVVASLNRPGGNVTGFAVETELMDPKRLGLLRDLAPGVLLFGALVNPNYPAVARQLQQPEEAARAINQRLFIAKASTDPELDAAFASLKRVGAARCWSPLMLISTRGATG